MDKRSGGSIMIFSRNFFVSQCRKFSYRKPSALCFEKISCSESVYGSEGRKSINIFRRKFLTHSAEKLWRGILFVSIFSGFEKLYAAEGYGTIFPEFFCLKVSDKILGEPYPSVFQKISGSE